MGDSYTIQISTKLINQLAQDEEKSKRKTKKPMKKPKTPKDQNAPKPSPPPNPNPPQPTWPPLFLPVPPPVPAEIPEVESIRTVLKESEKVLEKLEVEESKMLEELNKRSKELREKEFKLPYQKEVPCVKERADCLECYKNYPKDPLKCAEFVKRFADCARKSRQNA